VTAMGAPVTRSTTLGDVTGRIDSDGIERYFGIPTSPDMGGARRWTRPTAMPAWTTPIETVYSKPCSSFRGTEHVGSEDCVSVDVMTYQTAANRPVVMWTHGGGFTREDLPIEHMTNAYYQKAITIPTVLPDSGRIVTVLNHYRLSTLGWFVHRGLEDNAEGASGNYGMMDAVHNLQWIAANIGSFGGDATRVTIMGESAGAAHTTALLSSPVAQPFFANAIIESPYISFMPSVYGRTARYQINTILVYGAGCGPIGTGATGQAAVDEIDCMRTADFADFEDHIPANSTAAYDAVFGPLSSTVYTYAQVQCWPVQDGYMLTMDPVASFASGVAADKGVIIGSNSDEYSSFYGLGMGGFDFGGPPFLQLDQGFNPAVSALPITATADEVVAAVLGFTPNLPPAGLYTYTDNSPSEFNKVVQKATDAWFGVGLHQVVTALNAQPARTPGTVYRFLYAQEPHPFLLSQGFAYAGGCHGCELDYVLGLYEEGTAYFVVDSVDNLVYSPEYIQLGQTMKSYWVNMMHYGHPNRGTGLPRWHPSSFMGNQELIYFKASLPMGAAMAACATPIACVSETIGGVGGFRSRKVAFWSGDANYMSMSDNVCDRPVGGVAMAALTQCPAPPPATCLSWCNVYTCGAAGCEECSACVNHSAGQTCEAWCNVHTCDMQACLGCPQATCPHVGEHCEAWCNDHTCGDDMCAGCTACASRRH